RRHAIMASVRLRPCPFRRYPGRMGHERRQWRRPMSHAPKDARLAALPQAAARIVEALGLAPHPEGGWFAEVCRSPAPGGGRWAVTTIYFLLARGERSHWHRVDAEEVWHHYAGAPLALDMAPDDAAAPRRHLLGFDPLH